MENNYLSIYGIDSSTLTKSNKHGKMSTMDITANGQQIIEGFGPQAGIVILTLLVALGAVIREWRRREFMHEKRQERMYLETVAMSQAMIKTDNETNRVLESLEKKIDDAERIRTATVDFLIKQLERGNNDD